MWREAEALLELVIEVAGVVVADRHPDLFDAPVGRQEEGGSGIEPRVTEALGERNAGVSLEPRREIGGRQADQLGSPRLRQRVFSVTRLDDRHGSFDALVADGAISNDLLDTPFEPCNRVRTVAAGSDVPIEEVWTMGVAIEHRQDVEQDDLGLRDSGLRFSQRGHEPRERWC